VVKESRFDPAGDLLIVRARIWGPRGGEPTPLQLAIDTGSSHTVIVPDIIEDLGYSPRQGEAITSVRAALGKEQGYILRVSRFAALGYAMPDFAVHVFDLAEGFGIDGLIGLSFLHQFNYTVRSAEGRLLVEPVAAAAS
jgi:predicted aspartyl protease